MTSSAIMAFIHHLAAFTLFASILFEHLTFKRDITAMGAKRILTLDAVYGITAMAVLVAGFLRAIYFEKGWGYYSNNTFFWIKLHAFLAVGLLSIYPTITFLSWRKAFKQRLMPAITDSQFKWITWLLRLELLGLLIMLWAAAMMARGIDTVP